VSAHFLSAALVFLIASSPILLFPDLLPPTSYRTEVVATIAVLAMALGVVLMGHWRLARGALVVFLAALVVSWTRAWVPWDETTSLRHFSGVGLGVLAMGVTAAWARTPPRLMHAARIVVAGALAVLTIGWLGAAVNPDKLTAVEDTSVSAIAAASPVVSLRLPGLSLDGLVNSNALGGTALLVLPLCLGLYAAGRRLPHLRLPTLLLAGTASAVATLLLAITLSRTAWLAAGITVVLFLVRANRSRRWLLGGLAALLVVGLCSVWFVQATNPARVASARAAVQETLRWRVLIWQDGVDHVRASPLLGSGINRIHSGKRAYPTFRITHFHNIALQVAVDAGLVGLGSYGVFVGWLLLCADRTARRGGVPGIVAAGAGLSLIAVHLFGLTDAIALGAKVGLFQWLSAGLIFAAARLTLPPHSTTTPAP